MMKAFLNRENSAAEPLLAADKKSAAAKSSSEDARVPLKAALAAHLPPLSIRTCQAPPSPVAMTRSSTGSTAHCSPDCTPNPSPIQVRKELDIPRPQSPSSPCGSPTVSRRKDPSYRHMSPPGSPISGRGRKDPSNRHLNIISPSAIAHKKRSSTLPASFSSPTLSGTGDDDLPIVKMRSEGNSRISKKVDHSFECKNKHGSENAHKDFDVERRVVALKPSQVKHDCNERQARGRSGTSAMLPEAKPRPRRVQSGPVDVDEMEGSSSLYRAERPSQQHAKAKPSKRGGEVSTRHSAPTGTGLYRPSLGRLDTERLLSQMGMDVTEDDYCLEGEFARRKSQEQTRQGRCHSYDCNYDHPLEEAYEDFGVERMLVELKKRPAEGRNDKKKRTRGVRSITRMVRRSIGNIGNNGSDDRDTNRKHCHGRNVHGKRTSDRALKSRVISVFRGKPKDKVPDQILAAITPTASDDAAGIEGIECVAPEDMRMLYRWQTARMRSSGGQGGASVTGSPAARASAAAPPSSGKMKCEDVLSIGSSCGDRTAPVDNRRRRHRQGFSF